MGNGTLHAVRDHDALAAAVQAELAALGEGSLASDELAIVGGLVHGEGSLASDEGGHGEALLASDDRAHAEDPCVPGAALRLQAELDAVLGMMHAPAQLDPLSPLEQRRVWRTILRRSQGGLHASTTEGAEGAAVHEGPHAHGSSPNGSRGVLLAASIAAAFLLVPHSFAPRVRADELDALRVHIDRSLAALGETDPGARARALAERYAERLAEERAR